MFSGLQYISCPFLFGEMWKHPLICHYTFTSSLIIKNCFMRKYALHVVIIIACTTFFCSCQKQIDEPALQQEELATAANKDHGHLMQTNRFPATVAQKWQ